MVELVQGKSIIALEVIRAEGNGYITVPRIYHQEQYIKDYSDENSKVYMEDEERGIIPIVTMKGKANFRCKLAKTEDYKERVKQHPEAQFVDWGNDRFIANEIEILQSYRTREKVAHALADSFYRDPDKERYYIFSRYFLAKRRPS